MENVFDLLKFKATLKPADEKTIAQFKGILPDFLLQEWQQRGFASYANGLLITTNPNDFYDVMEDWDDEPQKCHLVMRIAFGGFYYLKNEEFHYRSVVHNLKPTGFGKDLEVIIEFGLTDKGTQRDMFFSNIYTKALKHLGEQAYDEVYAFVPAIALGGDYNPASVQKVKLKEHLAFLSQL